MADLPGILILAAGASRRMGRSKQLLKWQGISLLEHAVSAAKGVDSASIYVVLGANSQEILKEIQLDGVEVVQNDDWNLGMGRSLSFGLKSMLDSIPELKSVLVTLADLPLIDASHLQSMIQKFEGLRSSIIATRYPETSGVPAIYGSDYFEEILDLSGDKGGKSLLNKHKDHVKYQESRYPFLDVDSPEAYDFLLTNFPGS